ncbi:Rrf2 family transcriptional regulator, nitric oxide-sensitive transcriptional repressor [Roseivivax halotolerans]|jgi:Rrf2 family nitric oxide-sensitive transcriptional repressor|uniref:Rrf2 family transcriptional regulator, nitric oxide-sensitive transcriptional repressor n=1 Tax=Roseivivax halotolerans TaxID=93684 RepID=A0A1I5XT46_9RHOB|nr:MULTISPECIES: Rrf2 family transcriptional regulator [Roseivivax]QFT62353.1 HTH-type transcriptional repressor NsrR [Roseivivax sp. THAF30]SFQ35094.1 Rrf2 family transcriptional regulator, nitric oxide-sensitive transcriptional repressor [Roseivivax halotolerans]
MRVNKRTNIAVRVLMYCTVHRDKLVTKAEIARSCNSSEHHLGQIVNQLAQLGYLSTRRGRHGGLMLGMNPEDITLGTLFRHFESKGAIVECFQESGNTCPLVNACRLRASLQNAMEAFFAALENVTVSDLVVDNTELAALFDLPDDKAAVASPEHAG